MINVGDIVKCILPTGSLEKDKIYLITGKNGALFFVNDTNGEWLPHRFKKIEGEELEEFRKKQELLKSVHIQDDPYGEDIWESKLIKEFKDYSILLDIIHNNVLKSEAEFGLIIRDEDVELEKKVIMDVFKNYGFKKWNEYSNEEYTKTFREVYDKISSKLEPQLKYYFYNTPEGQTKTRYNCHLEYLISDLFRVVVNNEAVKWYSKGKLTIDPTTNYVINDDFITDDEFRNFLIDNNAYDEFIEYCHDKYKRNFNLVLNNNKRSIIDNCLTWSETPSKNDFWSNLNDKWNRYR